MSAIMNKLACSTPIPAAPGATVSFQIPAGEGFADLTRSKIELDVQPSATGVPALVTPGGGNSFIQSVEISSLQGGEILERIQNYNILAAAVMEQRGSNTAAYRELVNRESISDLYQWTNVPPGGLAASIARRKVFVDLNLLGLGKWSQCPVAALGGLKIDIVLSAASAVFSQWMLGGPVSCAGQAVVGGTGVLTLTVANGEYCYPNVDINTHRKEFPLNVNEQVFVVGQNNTGPDVRGQFTAITYISPSNNGSAQGMQISFTAPLAAFDDGIYNNFQIYRRSFPVVYTTNTTLTSYNQTIVQNCPLYIGQRLSVWAGTAANPSEFTGTDLTTITAITQNGNNVVITVDTAIAGGAVGGNVCIYAAPIANLNYSVLNARFNLQKLSPPASALAGLSSLKSLAMPIITCEHIAITQPANMMHWDFNIPTPISYHSALGVIVVPTLSGSSNYDDSVRGTRQQFGRFRFTVNGQSDPLQPIQTSAMRPTVYDIVCRDFWQQLAAAASQMSPGSLPQQERLQAQRSEWFFAKAFNQDGMPRNIAGLSVSLEVDAVPGYTFVATTLHAYVFHIKTIDINAGQITVV